jgi:ABC-type polar amino acid transport system ATPase subunit
LASLSLIDVRKSYGSVPVLDGVSLEMQPKEFVAFLGPSGSMVLASTGLRQATAASRSFFNNMHSIRI